VPSTTSRRLGFAPEAAGFEPAIRLRRMMEFHPAFAGGDRRSREQRQGW
jgi:hypothetical protein